VRGDVPAEDILTQQPVPIGDIGVQRQLPAIEELHALDMRLIKRAAQSLIL